MHHAVEQLAVLLVEQVGLVENDDDRDSVCLR